MQYTVETQAKMTKYNAINDTYLSLLVTAQLEVLASLDGQHSLGSAVGLHALKPQHNLLCCLSLKREYIIGSDFTQSTAIVRVYRSDN